MEREEREERGEGEGEWETETVTWHEAHSIQNEGKREAGEREGLLEGREGGRSRECYPISSWTMGEFMLVVLLGVAFAFARTVVFIQLRITPLFAESITEGVVTSTLDTVPLACMFYGGTFAVIP